MFLYIKFMEYQFHKFRLNIVKLLERFLDVYFFFLNCLNFFSNSDVYRWIFINLFFKFCALPRPPTTPQI